MSVLRAPQIARVDGSGPNHALASLWRQQQILGALSFPGHDGRDLRRLRLGRISFQLSLLLALRLEALLLFAGLFFFSFLK
jgi:hypothetical protein